MVNYRGQPQADLTCMQQVGLGPDKVPVVFRNDPSTNCFGFPSIQFDSLPVQGGKPNGITIDWSLMVDELQMQDDDRLHIHLPGFTGAHNTFGIMGPAINSAVKGQQYAPNFDSERVKGDVSDPDAERADFGALVGIWGISCGTEGNLYMDRAKVDNIRTAEWDPVRETLRVVIKGRRYGPATGRHDGYTGPNITNAWVGDSRTQGKLVPWSATAGTTGAYAPVADNSQSPRGNHLQAMEYSREGPSGVTSASAGSSVLTSAAGLLLNHGGAAFSINTPVASDYLAQVPNGTRFIGNFLNDGYVHAPGNRVCGIYIDPTKLHRAQRANQITTGLGPLPPYGGIGKNWYKLAYIRRFAAVQCSGGVTDSNSRFVRPGMLPETCSPDKSRTTDSLSRFWQVPFDGDTERVVGYQFTTTRQQLPTAVGASPYGTVQAPTFSFAQAKGRTDGPSRDNCITISLIPSVDFVSGTASTQITIKGLKGSGTSDSDTLPLYEDDRCNNLYTTLVGANGRAIKSFKPVAGTAATRAPDSIQHNFRPVGRMAFSTDGTGTMMASTSNPNYDDADWHTRARQGTTSALTKGGFTAGEGRGDVTRHTSTLQAADSLTSKLVSSIGELAPGNGAAKFVKADGTLTFAIAPGYFLQAGELLVFSVKLQNPKDPQPSQDLTVSATGTYCNPENPFCTGATDAKLEILDFPMVSKGKILETKAPYFATSKIFQSSSDPDDLTTIFVTLKPNVDLKRSDAAADAKITITGLCGFQTGSNVQLYQNQKAGGLPLTNDGHPRQWVNSEYPIEAVRSKDDIPGLGQDDSRYIDHRAEYEPSTGTLKIKLGNTGFVADRTYAFAFQLQTGKTANDACVPKISATGTETIAEQEFASATNIGLTMAPMFTTIKIGQVTTRPDVTNYLCVTLQHNYEFYSDSVVGQNAAQTGNYIESKITISGLTGTQAVSTPATGKGIPLTYCPTDLVYFDDKTTQYTSTQFQPAVTVFTPKPYKTSCFGTSAATQQCIPGNPYVPDDAFDTSVAGRSWFGGQTGDKDTFTWDQATGTAVLTVDPEITKERKTNPQTIKGGIPKNAQIVFALPLQNSKEASDCREVSFEASGRIVQKATFVQTQTGRALQDGEQDGDACALKVYPPGFLVKQITQSTAVTGADNIITVSLRTNVDFASVASGQASYITISGLTGTATSISDLGIIAPKWRFSPKFENNQGKWTQSTGVLELKLEPGTCEVPTVWAAGDFYDWNSQALRTAPFALGGTDATAYKTAEEGNVAANYEVTTAARLGSTMPSTCIKAGYLYVFSFQVLNPSAEQAAPAVSIGGRYRDLNNNEQVIANAAIDPPISDDIDKVPMRISDQTLTTVKIGQLIPAPSAANLICVTLKTSKDIKSESNAQVSTITISGLTGFDATEQQLQLYENDGTTVIPFTVGNPKTNSYRVGTVFSAQNTQNRGSEGAGYVHYSGSATGQVTMWIQGNTATDSVVNFMQKDVEHKFCFRLKNPKVQMECKDISVTVNNQGTISTVKAEQDMTTTIEDYPYGSACVGYVASPGFVVANWRSSTNTTSGNAIIHLELASNLLLETGDKITVSGLTSYTRSCSTPPCDVSIDVTRLFVNYSYGKPMINGKRSVTNPATGDKTATAEDRKAFALAIQSYDLTGTKDGGGFTSTFGDVASWGKVGDTQDSASTLTFTVATNAKMTPSDITLSSEATLYEIVFSLNNRPTAVSDPAISINIGQGSTQYPAQPLNLGQTQPDMGINVSPTDGSMDITYTPQKTIYGGESLILTLPHFTRDSNGMLFGVTSSPNSAFQTYSTWQDWKAYGTTQKYARAFFTNGWYADGITAKSGDSGQTGERWNYPNINAKATTDADYNHDTGIFVLDINDPGIGVNKNYWYANTEDNVYEGRVTRVSSMVATGVPGAFLSEATTDYFLDNGEALVPIAAVDNTHYEQSANGFSITADMVTVDTTTGAPSDIYYRPVDVTKPGDTSNGYRRPHLVVQTTPAGIAATNTRNNLPGNLPQDAYRGKSKLPNTPEDDFAGTPPFKGIPDKFQPSKRDNFYRGMLMKCWIGTKDLGGKTDYSEDRTNDLGDVDLMSKAGMFRAPTAARPTVQTLLPPPERIPSVPTFDTVDSTTNITTLPVKSPSVSNAKAFEKAGVSRVLETRVIQASFRQIDYIPRKLGGCHWNSRDHPTDSTQTQPATASMQQAGCQDEVPGYPAVVRLESPFSRTLDPDTLCYIQRKADVGVYTGMTAMIGSKEYTIKQGAANIYTVSHVAQDMTGINGDPVDRKVPRSYSTEDLGIVSAKDPRTGDNQFGFFRDGVGLSGQPYLIYSQLELVAKREGKVSVGETITITIPASAMIKPPSNMDAWLTRSNDKDKISDKVKISHVLLVPLSSACSIVSVYGVQSGCQHDNRRGGSFDLILSTQWPYAYDRDNKNDLTGYGMTVFGGQSTVITTMADKYSQDLPVTPLEGNSLTAAAALDPSKSNATLTQSRQQTRPSTSQKPASNLETDDALTVVRELETLYLTGGSLRSTLLPKMPNAPITLTSAGCGSRTSANLGAATLPYAVCLTLGGSLAHNQFIHEDVIRDFGTSKYGTAPGNAVDSFITGKKLATPRQNQGGVIVAGVQSITGAVGQEVTPVIPATFSSVDTSTYGSARPKLDGNFNSSAGIVGSLPGAYENPADNLGLGAYIIVGVYNYGTSDRFLWSGMNNKGSTTQSALPKVADMATNRVVQRYIGTSRQTIPLANVPSGLIGGTTVDKPTTGFPAPAGQVPRYQARVAGGYATGRYSYGQSKIMRVRSDVTSNAFPLGTAPFAFGANPASLNLGAVASMSTGYETASAIPNGLPASVSTNDKQDTTTRDNHFSGFPAETASPNIIEKLIYGRSTLPLPQVIHTADGVAAKAATSRLTRGHCGQGPTAAGTAPSAPTPYSTTTNETCAVAALTDFNLNLPFSRNVYIEQGQDVYIISSLFDSLVQRPEPPRQHLAPDGTPKTIEGNNAPVNPGYFASSADGSQKFPGSAKDSNASPRPTYMRPRSSITAATRYGSIQTAGTVPAKAYGMASNQANVASAPALTSDNQYGFDQDFRLFSVLGPFMGPAKIKDVWDSAKIRSAYTSNFPGVLTIHAKVSEEPAGTSPVFETMQNNALYHTAPVVGTSYVTSKNRLTQYHTYDQRESDKIISFCNPLQSDLNNAPGAVLNNEISDDPASVDGRKIGGPEVNTGTFKSTWTGFQTSNGVEATAPSQWTVPRRHHICRKLITGAPELTAADRDIDPHVILAAASSSTTLTQADKEKVARYRFTESIRFNTVLNQEPSPNMRAMVTFVEPTTIKVTFNTGGDPCVLPEGKFDSKTKVDASCKSLTFKGPTTSVIVPYPTPDWFSLDFKEIAYDGYNFTDADVAGITKGVSDKKRGVTVYDKDLVVGHFTQAIVPDQNKDDPQGVTFQVKAKSFRTADVTGLEKRRRLLATCADGFEVRQTVVGSPIKDACKCPSACGVDEATCSSKVGGIWTLVNIAKKVCAPSSSPYDPTGAIVGGVIGGFFGLLLLIFLAWFFCCRKKKEEQPWPRPVPTVDTVPPAKTMAPVYLPQPYPSLPTEQFTPAYPVPVPVTTVPMQEAIMQPTGQPTLYSSYQAAAPISFPAADPYAAPMMVTPVSYPAPYGVVPQPAYGI